MAWFRRAKDDESMDPQVLLAKADAAAPPPVAAAAGVFRMTVDDVFSIKNRGTVVTGTIEAGSVSKGGTVRLIRADGTARAVEVTGVEMFRKVVDTANAGDTVGLLLRSIERGDVSSGDVLSS